MKISEIFVTVDIVLIKKLIGDYELLLIKRRNEPFKDNWALPGGFVDKNEDLETAAIRELVEETSITVSELEQLKAFGKPFRDPRNHVVSVAFFGIVDENIVAKAADDAKEAKWFSVKELPKLAFDHDEIINFALLKHKLK